MVIKNDLELNFTKFDPKSVSKKTEALNEQLVKIADAGPRWYEVGAAKYRKMREDGETPLPKPTILDGEDIFVPSRESGRPIPCRVMKPKSGDVKGVFLHIHGGGWVLMLRHQLMFDSQDPLLKFLADVANLVVVSVGYRLAPEDPYPKGNEDCFDVAEYLVDNARAKFGGPLLFAGGESAGGHLATLVCFHLLQTRPTFHFAGLNLVFGAYDLAGFLPSTHTFSRTLVIDKPIMTAYINAYIPKTTEAERRDPWISPLYADFTKLVGKLPPALFTVGTEDPLLDDSIFMSAKWRTTGAETAVKFYSGCPHGFCFFPEESMDGVKEWFADVKTFLLEHVK
ncbi:MAG: hypothetical protein M1820_000180 [Bogoriella megaspora]|nr:MAG: hypothetical protein M1820_000180 [Bogoriella megaspora]